MQNKLHITYYTDPLCCWSWAMEPAWQRLLKSYEDRITWRYCMGGLLPDWKSYQDTEQHVSRPIQMGPVWLEAKYISEQPMDETIWLADPPASSYPACLAVKCAALQSAVAEHHYLYALRKAVMVEKRNIAKKEVLLAVADEVAMTFPEIINAVKFHKDLEMGNSLEDFRADLKEVSYRNIRRFPSLVLHQDNGQGTLIRGYRPVEVLLDIVQKHIASLPAPF